ncbi:hypothetical protein BX666DRAFT_1885982 [Dichotomocladium elegans]|nr:hypothetical protein BX666DRAFT_1885982 [Dichotomocladium elegans]
MQETGVIVPITLICLHPDCSTTLRSDNKGGLCAKHKIWKPSEKYCCHHHCVAHLRSDNDSGFCREHRQFYFTEASFNMSTAESGPPKQLKWPMVLCSYCNVSPVNAFMNEKRKCQQCSKVSKTNNNSNSRKRQRDEYVPFSFADGCKRAFRGSSSVDGQVISAEKAVNGAILMDYIPIAMHLQSVRSVSSPVMDPFAMVTQSFINDMHAASISFDTKHGPGTQLQVTLQLPEEEERPCNVLGAGLRQDKKGVRCFPTRQDKTGQDQ